MHARILMVAVALTAGAAQAATPIGFEGLSPLEFGSWGLLPSDYAGFTFTGLNGNGSWVVANSNYPGTPDFSFAPHTGMNYVVNNAAGDDDIISATPGGDFDFDSAWFRGAETPMDMTVVGYDHGVQVASVTLHLGNGYALQTLDIRHVNRLVFKTDGGQFLMDDFVAATVGGATPVPEPAAWASLLSGLALLGVARKRRCWSFGPAPR